MQQEPTPLWAEPVAWALCEPLALCVSGLMAPHGEAASWQGMCWNQQQATSDYRDTQARSLPESGGLCTHGGAPRHTDPEFPVKAAHVPSVFVTFKFGSSRICL